MRGITERLRELESKATPGPWAVAIESGDSFLTTADYTEAVGTDADTEFVAEMRNALPKLLAVVEAHRQLVSYCEDRFTWSAKPFEWEYMSDERELNEAKEALAALEDTK